MSRWSIHRAASRPLALLPLPQLLLATGWPQLTVASTRNVVSTRNVFSAPARAFCSGQPPPSSDHPPQDKSPPDASNTFANSSHHASSAQQTTSTADASPSRPPRNSSPLLSDPAKKRIIDKMIRVDHAGEIGARQIYAGQLAVFRNTPVGAVIAEMAQQEQKHLDAFDRLIVERRVRPTAMLPLWTVAGYSLGLATALIGKETAMACTVAVEEVIAEHYNDQVRTILHWDDEGELRDLFREFRDDELEHKDTGIQYDAERAPLYRAVSAVIKTGCRTAIAISERI